MIAFGAAAPDISAIADVGAGASQPAPARRRERPSRSIPWCGDGGSVDGRPHRLRRHSHCHHEPGGRRCRGRAAARDPRSMEEGGHGQPDRLGPRHRASSTTSSSNSRSQPSSSSCTCCFPARTSTVGDERGSDDSFGPGLEHERDAAHRGDRDGFAAKGEDHQHAAGARRQREPAGDAAGAVRRGQSPRPDGGRALAIRRPARISSRGRRRSSSLRRTSTSETTALCSAISSTSFSSTAGRHRRCAQGAAVERRIPEPG